MNSALRVLRTEAAFENKFTNLIFSFAFDESSGASVHIQSLEDHVVPGSELLILCSPGHGYVNKIDYYANQS